MKAKPAVKDPQHDLFRIELDRIIDRDHELCQLSELIDWESIDQRFGEFFPSKKGCPATPSRLIAGLFYLKATFKESDESLIEKWVENPYWQVFCGRQFFEHTLPIDPSSLSRWRKRLKEKGAEAFLEETIRIGLKTKAIAKKDLQAVCADTTVQEKAIAFPTDKALYDKARKKLVKAAKENGLVLKQSFHFLAKKSMLKAGQYGKAKQFKRMKKEVKKIKTYLSRVYREILRKSASLQEIPASLKTLLDLTSRLLKQQKNDKNKLYSLHAPEVECIAKGKAHKPYEFGVKVSWVCALTKSFVLGAQALSGNPYDGHTLVGALDQVEKLTGIRPEDCVVDLGYRGHEEEKTTVRIVRQKKNYVTSTLKKMMKRRNNSEAQFSHGKNNHHLGRNYLKGVLGDQFNALMSAVGLNLKTILRKLKSFLSFIFWCVLNEFLLRNVEFL